MALVREDAELVRRGVRSGPLPDAASRLKATLARFAASRPDGEDAALPEIEPSDPFQAVLTAGFGGHGRRGPDGAA